MEVNNSNSPPGSAPADHLEEVDFQLEQPAWSIDQLKLAAVQQRVLRPRSLAWAILLNALPPPNADIFTSLKSHRSFYNDLKSKLSMDPRTVIGDDPLSQNDESAWRQHFCDNELKNVILQDVVRTYPDELYFREQDVQELMVRVLFHWSRSHSSVGYRQGMHEILAPLLFELYLDRNFAPRDISDKLKFILSEEHLEHDSYMLFNTVMKGLERFYTTGDVVPSSCGRMPASLVVHNPNEVVRYLERVRDDYLVPLEPELAAHMAASNISMELFGIRWLRLLFGREFPRSEIPHLWGFLFADGPTLPNLHYIILAILLSVKDTIMNPDMGFVLSALMRPCSASAGHVCALALHLRAPLHHPRPPPPPASSSPHYDETSEHRNSLEQCGSPETNTFDSGSEGVAEGADVARELAALAVLRARLPPAVAALARALPRVPPDAVTPLHQILQLSALLQCRNHAWVDVETALEAAEAHAADALGRKQLVPVAVNRRPANSRVNHVNHVKVKEVPMKLFHQIECGAAGDLPCLDPLRLRTE